MPRKVPLEKIRNTVIMAHMAIGQTPTAQPIAQYIVYYTGRTYKQEQAGATA